LDPGKLISQRYGSRVLDKLWPTACTYCSYGFLRKNRDLDVLGYACTKQANSATDKALWLVTGLVKMMCKLIAFMPTKSPDDCYIRGKLHFIIVVDIVIVVVIMFVGHRRTPNINVHRATRKQSYAPLQLGGRRPTSLQERKQLSFPQHGGHPPLCFKLIYSYISYNSIFYLMLLFFSCSRFYIISAVTPVYS
jgi:hypothetical protein